MNAPSPRASWPALWLFRAIVLALIVAALWAFGFARSGPAVVQ